VPDCGDDRDDCDMIRSGSTHSPGPDYLLGVGRQSSQWRSAEVRINDRGPFAHERMIDLSPAAVPATSFWVLDDT
jgi:Lytic transglycolase